ncbi:hypothetical protein MPL3356_110108 [Mesorhizobium plurifarium]|uniref:LysR substrate-binding domain-containing protein n=1 Tax=Mesorhizobium plurifarium TaxID=69974 RepID=A0A090D9R6_MESPL|nr:hypothetical protein MPL3356_110108 [Mesorhizobium plurifarium]
MTAIATQSDPFTMLSFSPAGHPRHGAYQIVLMPWMSRLPSHFRSQTIFSEVQKLYCAKGHPLFDIPDERITDAHLKAQPFAGRTYMTDETICGVTFSWSAATPHMEGTLLLLLSGVYIGFLPDHYAEESVHTGQLRVIAPERMTFEDPFHIAYPRERPSRATEALARAIVAGVEAKGWCWARTARRAWAWLNPGKNRH